MTHWNRTRSAAEWGLFFGVCTWLLASGITNTMVEWNVWTMVLSRALIGLIIGLIKDVKIPWWARGASVGFVLNIPLGLLVNTWQDFTGGLGFWYMLGTGILAGFLVEVAVRHKEKELAAATKTEA